MGDWREFLEGVGEAVLEPGASADEIEITERRLGTTLPPGYRSFLATTNGFGRLGFSFAGYGPSTRSAGYATKIRS